MDKKKHIAQILSLLEPLYPGAKTELIHKDPFELLIATILSAQCTDKRVNMVTKELFKKYRTSEDFQKLDQETLEQLIRSTGFYHNKAKNIIASSKIIEEKFNSHVPDTMKELLTLPGVARKTANIVLTEGYGKIEGIAVDTHVARLSQRLGLTENKNPQKIERDLMSIAEKERWRDISNLLILHGRRICDAKKPKCNECVLNRLCPSAFKI